jgi:hypothetical protein
MNAEEIALALAESDPAVEDPENPTYCHHCGRTLVWHPMRGHSVGHPDSHETDCLWSAAVRWRDERRGSEAP